MEWIFPIERLPVNQGGGKAGGLALLKHFGRKIPATWVVTTPDPAILKPFIATLPVNKTWAIRSSAADEDSINASFAGQYETFLHVKGEDNILQAVQQCFQSGDTKQVASYRKKMQIRENGMSVIIQEMVIPRISGVLFTVDPVHNRHDKISLSVVTGTADQLMSGTREGNTLVFYRQQWDKQSCKLIPSDLFRQLIAEAIETEKLYGQPVDMEWAIDEKGSLYWLQLRPVTGLSPVHLNELDDTPRYPNPIYTRGNIGEMMPGPVTPLTLSTFGWAIDYGLQVFYKKSGVFSSISRQKIFIHSFYNYLFIDVNALYEMPKRVWLTSKENVDFSVVGEIVPGIQIKRDAPFWKAMINFIRTSFYMLHGTKAVKNLRKLEKTFHPVCPDDPRACYEIIDRNLQVLLDAYDLHYVSSSQSGGYFTTILNIYSGGKPPLPEHYEKVARLFTHIPGIESAQALRVLDDLAHVLAKIYDIKKTFLDVPVDRAISYLNNGAPENIRITWQAFLARHGHRCVREAEMREKEWALDPAPVVEGLKGKTAILLEGKHISSPAKEEPFNFREDKELTWFKRHLIEWLLPKARASVARREQTKALAILIQQRFKLAYRRLAKQMVNAGLLSDPDLIYFLTHKETGLLLRENSMEKYNLIAGKRRSLYSEMQQLSFPDISFGVPTPLDANQETAQGNLTGIPVSRGIAEGKVRLVYSLAEARMLKEGEIMVSRYTDVGWTPFYSIIKGMITEIGSPLSHGAVIAREYNLPALVSVKGAMNTLKNGQYIRLDAIRGEVEILN